MSEVTNSDALQQNPMVQKFPGVVNALNRQLAGNDDVYIDIEIDIDGTASTATLSESLNNQLEYLSVRISDQSGNEAMIQMDIVTYAGTADVSGLNSAEDWDLLIDYKAASLELQDATRITNYSEVISGTKASTSYNFSNQPDGATIQLQVDGVDVASGATASITATLNEDKQIVIGIVNDGTVPANIEAVALSTGSGYEFVSRPTTTFFIKEGKSNTQTVLSVDTSAAGSVDQDFLVRYSNGTTTVEYPISLKTTVS